MLYKYVLLYKYMQRESYNVKKRKRKKTRDSSSFLNRMLNKAIRRICYRVSSQV